VNSSALVYQIDVGTVPELAPREWRADLLMRRALGARCLTLYGRRAEAPESTAGQEHSPERGQSAETVSITAVLQEADGTIRVSRTKTSVEVGYQELTSQWPALHCFERELHEQTGVAITGHPWLKPIRFQGQEQSAMNAYPFYRIDGKEVHEVAVGPIHAGVIEPGSFRFACLGEQVHHLEIHLGYQHRGVERLLLERDPRRLAPLVETVAGDTSVAHTWAYCAALESLAGCELGLSVEVGRAVALELERVAMHLAGLSGMAADVGFLQGATSYGRLRTTAINTTMRLCGSRFGRGALQPGGIRMQMTPELLKLVRANLELLSRDLAIINEHFLSSWTVKHRLSGVGLLEESRARELGIVGMAARASGVPIDARVEGLHGAYGVSPIHGVVLSEGDCWARARIRIEEMDASLAWLGGILALYPDWERSRQPIERLAPAQLVVSLVEGWRGEVVHCLETNTAGGLSHYKVQDPSLRNWMGLALAVRHNEISDFPICNKSFDLSYCGNDL
jgi:Ni,Fe-hydrogenase III large subunit